MYLSIWDVFLTPLYLLVIITLARRYRDRHYPPGNPLRKYYLTGLYLKLGGAIFIGLVFQFLYGGGDTYNFFDHARIINSAMDDSAGTWLKLLWRSSPNSNPELYSYASRLYWYNDPASYTVAAIAAVLGLLNGTTYMPIALLFAAISYTGIWAMYRTFANIYPKLTRELAIAFLFIPSTFIWGSSIFKDTICMFGLGWMTYTTFRIFINKDYSVRNLLFLVLSFYLIAQIKLYILMGFLPALSLWLLMTYSRGIDSAGVRWLLNIAFIGAIAAGFLFFTSRFAEELNKYSLEKLAKTAEVTRTWTNFASGDEGSAYDLGPIDGSLEGMLARLPQAVAVTLFRPFLWESKKVIVLFSALEALLFLYFTLAIFRKRQAWTRLFRDPNALFCFIFAIIFSFSVGISAGNFGTLSRYKIPALPFYVAMLVIVRGEQKKRAAPPRRRPQTMAYQSAI